MAPRSLPKKRNPLLVPINDTTDPSMEEVVSKRRLGQTELNVDPGQVGTSNATKIENLGKFDYAHLRVPLPKDLKGSGVFGGSRNSTPPDAYFLMRRSSDGYISATGMFKVAFPWSSQAEEDAEKRFLKSLPDAGREEIAGNVWVPPTYALELAEEYSMRDWLIALLDPSPMAKGNTDPRKDIQSPPPFKLPSTTNGSARASSVEKTSSTRSRNLRSASPSHAAAAATPSRKIATPRRTKRGRPAVAGGSLAATAEEEGEADGERQQEAAESGSVKVDIESTTEANADGSEEVTKTHVTVETPANHPDLDLPNDSKAYLDQARLAIREANQLTAGRAAGRKRKASEMVQEDAAIDSAHGDERDAQATLADENLPVAKRVRFTEMELKKERIKRRATLGIAASLAVGAMLPVFMSTFFQSL